MEKSLVIVKPDGVKRGLVGEIIKRFENRGLRLVALALKQGPENTLKEHYKHLENEPYFGRIISFMQSGPIVVMVWIGTGAVSACRMTLGATNPAVSTPGTIRGDFALVIENNVCHASDSVLSAEREIALWFPEGIIDYLKSSSQLYF